MSDDELARQAAGGDADAFAELLRRHQEGLYSFLLYRVGGAADDVFQEVWMKVWRSLRSYEPRGRFGGWLMTVARRAALDHLRHEGRRAGEPLEADRHVDPAPGPERAAQARDVSERLREALAEMPDEQREVFLLREYGGLTFEEIAREQGCPLGTALARMRYAVEKLRRRLETLQ